MSRRGHFLLWGSILAGLLIVPIGYAISLPTGPLAPQPPEVGGQAVPARLFEIQYDQKYDLFCSFYREEPTIFRGCTIIGFTGSGGNSVQSGQGSGSVSFSLSSGSARSYAENFDHWLTLKLADGRMAYIPTHAIKYIEQASPSGK